MKIGIVGGGAMGLTLAYRLATRNQKVVVFENETQLGGLATHHDYGPFFWDRFYHVMLPSDTHLLALLKDLGLADRVRWSATRTGFYVDGRLHSIGTTSEFLRFPLISLVGKIRLALTILYCSRIRDWRRLETIPVADWLTKTCGRSTYEKFWKPLLLAKLGESYQRVSAVFIWSYIKRLFSARDGSAQSKEHLGYVSGGYKTVFARLEQMIRARGGDIRTAVSVRRVHPRAEGGLWVEHGSAREYFDKVIFTGPVNVLRKVAGPDLIAVSNMTDAVEYLGVICMVLVSRAPLVPYYVVNIADSRIPFTGVIGMTNVVSTTETAGRHLTYLPKYVLSTDPLLRRPDDEIRAEFLQGVRLMFPDFNEADIESVHINRAFKVQPLQVVNYSSLVPQVATAHPDFFVLNTSQFVNGTLNNNEVVRAAGDFLGARGAEFDRQTAHVRSAAAQAVPA
jgi:protoporphyrinogen oxidase